jgi:hypothetical protein
LAMTSQARAADDAAVQVVKALDSFGESPRTRPSRCPLTPPIAASESSYPATI